VESVVKLKESLAKEARHGSCGSGRRIGHLIGYMTSVEHMERRSVGNTQEAKKHVLQV
jgi:hypothetical protein